jgi:hypothetical protein
VSLTNEPSDSKSVALTISLDIRETLLDFVCGEILFTGVKKVTPAVTFAARRRTDFQHNKVITLHRAGIDL